MEVLRTLKTDAPADHMSLAMSLAKNETTETEREIPERQIRLDEEMLDK